MSDTADLDILAGLADAIDGDTASAWPGQHRAALMAAIADHAAQAREQLAAITPTADPATALAALGHAAESAAAARELAEAAAGADRAFTAAPLPPLTGGTTAGERCRQYRAAARLSASELALAADVEEKTLDHFERDSGSRAAWFRAALARGIAAADSQFTEAAVAAELLSLRPVTRDPFDHDADQASRALARSLPAEALRVARDGRLITVARRAAALLP